MKTLNSKWMPAVVGLVAVPITLFAGGVNPFTTHACQACVDGPNGLQICDTVTCSLNEDCSGIGWVDPQGRLRVRALCLPVQFEPIEP